MARRILLAASMIILLAATFAGCSGDDNTATPGPTGTSVSGRWKGTLSLAFVGPTPTATGEIIIDFNQDGNNASGIALWAPVGTNQGIAGSIDGDAFSFLLNFQCPSGNAGATLTGTVTDSTVINITGGSGIACLSAGGLEVTVAGAVGTLNRDSNPSGPTDPNDPDIDVESFLRFESVKVTKTAIVKNPAPTPDEDGEFILQGRIRNTGETTIEIAVLAKAKDGDFAISDEIVAETGVTFLDPGMWTSFTATTPRQFRKSVTWTYWAKNVTDDIETDQFNISK